MDHLYIIADTDSCDSLTPKHCEKCPLAKFRKRADGSYMSCADAVGFKHKNDGSYSRAATEAILEQIITQDTQEKI